MGQAGPVHNMHWKIQKPGWGAELDQSGSITSQFTLELGLGAAKEMLGYSTNQHKLKLGIGYIKAGCGTRWWMPRKISYVILEVVCDRFISSGVWGVGSGGSQII